MKIVTRFKNDPSTYYAMSIAATWAGVGSLMMGIEMAQKHGLLPFLLWSLGNTLACIVYGILAPSIPKLRDVFRSKIMRTITGLMCPFQVWISLNGIQMIFSETPLGRHFGTAFAVIVAVTYIVMLWHRGMIRNVLHDHISWIAVYALAFVVTVLAIYSSGFSPISLGADASSLSVGVNKMLLLVPGAFLYPYFFEILDYNDDNADGTHKVDIRMAFVNGGILFGVYLMFPAILSLTSFGPVLSIAKAVLITLIAVSSLSSFQYSIYVSFGRPLGLTLNAASIALWPMVMAMGVMGVWTLMGVIRVCIVLAGITAAIAWHLYEGR